VNRLRTPPFAPRGARALDWVESLPSALVAVDAGGGVLAASPAARELLGAAAVRGADVFTAFPVPARADARAALGFALATPGVECRREGRLALPDGRRPIVRFTLRAVDGAVLVACEETGEQRRTAREAEYLRALAATALETTSDGMLVLDRHGRVHAANARFLELWRIRGPLAPGTTDRMLLERVRPQLTDPDAYMARVRAIAGAADRGSHDLVRFVDGRVYERYSQPLLAGGRPAGRVWSFSDVTEHRLAGRVPRPGQEGPDPAGDGDAAWDWEVAADVLDASPRWSAMLGLDGRAAPLTLAAWMARVHTHDRERLLGALHAHLRGEQPGFECEYRALHADGSVRWMLCRGVAVRDECGAAVRVAGSQADVTGARAAGERLAIHGLYDDLTGLPNRTLFKDRLRQAVRRAAHGGAPFAVALLDLDRFNVINESLGHAVGDEVLRAVAARLERGVRPGDTVARFGADVFTLLLEGVDEASEATRIAGQVLQSLGSPIPVGGREVFTTATAGLVIPRGGESAGELLRDADTAMHRAKSAGRSRCQLFDPGMHAQAVARLQLETELRRAVDQAEFAVVYQPLMRLATGAVEGFEALVRWRRPDGTSRAPAEVIPMAEETGLIVPLGIQVLRAACAQVSAWRARPGCAELHVNVNLSARQLSHPGLAAEVAAVLADTGLDGGALRLEITESALAETAAVNEATAGLRALGVRLCIDDFGTGYSSLAYLHRLPVDCLKIDRSFVNRLGSGHESAEIVRTILALARNLGLQAVAEGVETDAQLRFVREAGCDYGQGFGLHVPMDADAATALLDGGPLPAD
jgi:diguanylate cyclase (GGDEF)-like protein/PAS domain S-box-containing protein